MPKGNVLIIEDNEVVRNLIKHTLVNADFKVYEAETGLKSVELLAKQQIDLIILDFFLPDLNAFKLNAKIRSIPHCAHVPIIVLVGFLTAFDELKAITTKFNAYLVKPIEPDLLLNLVKNYLPKTAPKTKRDQRILVVDDDPTQLKLLTLHLKHQGFRVDTATDGEHAWQKINADPPDVVVSDILMPRLDGFELCLRVRKTPQFNHLLFILISSQYLEPSDRALAKKTGANAFVTRTEDLEKVIHALIENIDAKHTEPPIPDQDFKEEYIQRLNRQLERQVDNSKDLAQRSALQHAQLSLFKGLTDSFTSNKPIEVILRFTLAIALDAAGLSKGLLYLLDSEQNLRLKEIIGYEPNEKSQLEHFFNFEKLLQKSIDTQTILQIPSTLLPREEFESLLWKAQVNGLVIVPLTSTHKTMGVLVLAANYIDIAHPDFIAFARALGKQLAQAIELSATLTHLVVSEARTRTLMDTANCGIMLCKTDGTILEVNKELTNLFGADKQTIIGKNYESFIVPIDREYTSLLFQKLMIEKNIGPNEGRIQREDGSIRDIEYTINFVTIGNDKLIFALLNDVTERNRLRAQAMLSEKLATIGSLAAGIVHEINNPLGWLAENLSFIQDYLKTLEEQMSELHQQLEEKDADQIQLLNNFVTNLDQQLLYLKEMAKDTINGVLQVRAIVRDLKGFARIDEEVATNTNIHDVIEAAIKMAQHEFKYHVKLERKFVDNIPSSLLQFSRLQQVFLNLIINAAQAMPKENYKENRIIIKTYLKNNFIHIVFKDTGSGIAPDILPKIFEKFFTTKPIGVGTGLGLPICCEIVRNLGGRIEVQSELGKGSIFSVIIPLQIEVQKIETNISETHPASARILVIDDEPSLIKTLQRILEPHYQVLTALGGRAALDLIRSDDFAVDLIITDLHMPVIDGIDLYRFVAEKHPGLEKNILFITGDCDRMKSENFLAALDNSCIEKPFTKEELLRTVEKLISATTTLSH